MAEVGARMHTYFPRLVPFFDRVARMCDIRSLEAATDRIHQKYTGGPRRQLEGLAEHVAYALCRMPATLAATNQAFAHLKRVAPLFEPQRVLDIGSGPGTAALGATLAFPSVREIVGYERNTDFISLSETLFSTVSDISASFTPLRRDVEQDGQVDGSYDLMTAAYVFGELSEEAWKRWLKEASTKAKVVLLVEPGTPDGWARLMKCRDEILSLGGELLAPCPHKMTCPFTGTAAWCHEAVRLPRTAIHRRLKGGELGYEDEKFSYLAATFDPTLVRTIPPARIVHAPKHRHGHSIVTLCTFRGQLETSTISRKYKDLYRLVREARWGDLLPQMKEEFDENISRADQPHRRGD